MFSFLRKKRSERKSTREATPGLVSGILQSARKRTSEWRGSWNRPVKIDEGSIDPLTMARMTDHNVRGVDSEKKAG